MSEVHLGSHLLFETINKAIKKKKIVGHSKLKLGGQVSHKMNCIFVPNMVRLQKALRILLMLS